MSQIRAAPIVRGAFIGVPGSSAVRDRGFSVEALGCPLLQGQRDTSFKYLNVITAYRVMVFARLCRTSFKNERFKFTLPPVQGGQTYGTWATGVARQSRVLFMGPACHRGLAQSGWRFAGRRHPHRAAVHFGLPMVGVLRERSFVHASKIGQESEPGMQKSPSQGFFVLKSTPINSVLGIFESYSDLRRRAMNARAPRPASSMA